MTRGPAFLLSVSCAFSASPLLAVPPDPDFEEQAVASEATDEQGAMYGRLRHLEGPLSLRRADGINSELIVNEPITPGDVLLTGVEGRAEIQLADGSLLFVDQQTELVLLSLPDGTGQYGDATILQLAAGSIIVQAGPMDSDDERFQIDTDDASIFLLTDGIFRVNAEPGLTTLLSRRGSAEVMADEVSAMARSGERVTVRDGGPPGEPHVVNTRLRDEFEMWVVDRGGALLQEEPAAEPPGLPEPVRPYASELSYYGTWYNNPTYGWVWRPVGLASTWQPYLYGRWAWAPAGPVWVSYEPWGWAPFHYGRWDFLIGTGWIWIPGHVFAGAHVAWSVSPGYFGWCPLGYYNRPIAFGVSFGYHRDPWVYVRGHHVYARHIHSVAVKDPVIVRGIRREGVVVRGHPRIHPVRSTSGPDVTTELHRTFSRRPDLQIAREQPGERRVPFRESERQKLVRLNARRVLEQARRGARGADVGGDPTISVPRVRSTRALSGEPRVSDVPRRQGSIVSSRGQQPRPTYVRGVPVQSVRPSPRGSSVDRPSVRRTAPAPSDERSAVPRQIHPRARERASAVPDEPSKTPPRSRIVTPSSPERLVPKIIQRSRAASGPTAKNSPARKPSSSEAKAAPAKPSGGGSSGKPAVRGNKRSADKGKKD